jgi:hypothetical protein
VEQNARPRNTSTKLHSFAFLTKDLKMYLGEKIDCSTNGAGKTGYLHAKD